MYWFQSQLLYLTNMYKMGRFADSLSIISSLSISSSKLSDTFFFTRVKEIESMIHMANYNLPEAHKSYEDILTRGKTHFIVNIVFN